MKRRAADSGKMRRPVKRTKITEGMYGNSMLYLKFVMLWATVVMADYMLEFRFEFLWPFWMMLRSVYDSFKYQGLAFSVFFICIALTSDMICFFFIPVQWVFFAASTYVWVQYVWYTASCLDKGICLPTVVLCCVLVYVEGAVRGVRERGGGLGGGGLDLCRPFAAHCVGYPVVTLGFGVKSYVGHRMRLRRQREVQAENEFYYQLLRQALPEPTSEPPPKEEKAPVPNGTVEKTEQEKLAYLLSRVNGSAVHACGAPAAGGAPAGASAGARSKKEVKRSENGTCMHEDRACAKERPASNHNHTNKEKDVKTQHSSSNGTVSAGGGGGATAAGGGGGADEKPVESNDNHNTPNDKSKGNSKASSKWEKKEKEANIQKEEKRKNRNKEKEKEKETTENNKSCEQIKENVKEKEAVNTKEVTNKEKEKEREKEREQREREKEARSWSEELRKVRGELAASRASETELRRSLAAAQAAERARRHEHTQLKHAHDELQIKVTSLTGWRAGERAALERRLGEERQRRSSAERQLQAAHRQQQQRQHQAKTSDCGGEWCRSRRAASDAESASLRRELQRSRDRGTQLQRELSDAEQQVSVLDARCREVSVCAAAGAGAGEAAAAAALQQQQLASALAVLKERAAHLERSLSAETRIKLDLFSALGEAKRQLQIREGVITTQEKEIDELKAKIAQMLAVMPTESFASPAPAPGGSKLRLPGRRSPESLLHQANSQLDPNASVYTPKNPATCSDV